MFKKNIIKKLLIFGVPLVSFATIGTIIAVVINKNKLESNSDLSKKEIEITKNENNWFIYLKTDDKEISNKTVVIGNLSFEAKLVNQGNENFWKIKIPEDAKIEKGKYKITLANKMTTKANISELYLNWPLFEITPAEKKSEIVVNFNEYFNAQQISYKLEKENNSLVNLKKSLKITNNQILISIPPEWPKSKYVIKSIYLDFKTKIFSNNFLEENKELLTLSNYELGQLLNENIVINSENLEFNQDSSTEKKLYLINEINQVSIIKGRYDSKNIIFDINHLNKEYKWKPFRLTSKNLDNNFEKTLAENKDFSKDVESIYKKNQREIKVKKVELLDSNNILFFIKDDNNWINDNIKFKLNDKLNLSWSFLNENLKIIKVRKDDSFNLGDKITLSSKDLSIINPEFNISKNINASKNYLTVFKENDKLIFNFNNPLISKENAEINFKILAINNESNIVEHEKLFTDLNNKNIFEVQINELTNTETLFIVPSLVELKHGGNNEIFNFSKESLNLVSITEKQKNILSIIQKEENDKSTLLRIKLPDKYKRMNNYLFTLEYNGNIIYGFSELDDLTFYVENIKIIQYENIKITNLYNNEKFFINKNN